MDATDEMTKPVVSETQISDLVHSLYGLTMIGCKTCDSYCDLCFIVTVDVGRCANDNLKNVDQTYVLKILNSADSKNVSLIEAQHVLMDHLRKKNFSKQSPVPNVHGALYSHETFSTKNGTSRNIVEMKTFIPGVCISQVPQTKDLLCRLGSFMGRLRLALQDFHFPFYENYTNIWSLSSVPSLRQISHFIQDAANRELVHGVIRKFQDEVLSVWHLLPKGVIHGDANDNNILVNALPDQDNIPHSERKLDICGIIDFFDVQTSALVMDLAIAICYMMIEANNVDPFDVPSYVISGYRKHVTMTALESDSLYVSIMARLAQSLTIGTHTYSLNPDNKYLTITFEKGWPLLRKLWVTPKQELHKRWMTAM